MNTTVSILGIPVDRLTMRETVDRIEQFIIDGGFHQVATANTDFLVNALSDDELSRILRSADLVTADGMPVVWAARALSGTLPERVAGVDLVPELAALAAARGYSLFLLGARQEVALRAAANLELQFPGLRVVGCSSPPDVDLDDLDAERSANLLSDIHSAKPDILLVAFGNPKQEKWIYRNRTELRNIPVCIGVGGTFDLLAGEAHRAPRWMQRNGLEWLHRLFQDPRRLWKRYNRDFWVFSWHLLRGVMETNREIRPRTSSTITRTCREDAASQNAQ